MVLLHPPPTPAYREPREPFAGLGEGGMEPGGLSYGALCPDSLSFVYRRSKNPLEMVEGPQVQRAP